MGGGGGEKRETKEAKQQSNVPVNLSWASPIPSVKPLQKFGFNLVQITVQLI